MSFCIRKSLFTVCPYFSSQAPSATIFPETQCSIHPSVSHFLKHHFLSYPSILMHVYVVFIPWWIPLPKENSSFKTLPQILSLMKFSDIKDRTGHPLAGGTTVFRAFLNYSVAIWYWYWCICLSHSGYRLQIYRHHLFQVPQFLI